MFIVVGESVSGTYCGTFESRGTERRGAEEEEGYCRWCLLVPLELLESEEAVDNLLDAPRRCSARGLLPMPDMSPVMPARLPISVDVRSMDMTPGARSGLSAP